MSSHEAVRVALIGTATRSDYLYGPWVKALPEEVELVAVWGRSEGSARRLGESLHAPHYTSLDMLIRETAPQIGIISVAYHANGQVGLMAVEHGLHVLLETPFAHDLREADAIIATEAPAEYGLPETPHASVRGAAGEPVSVLSQRPRSGSQDVCRPTSYDSRFRCRGGQPSDVSRLAQSSNAIPCAQD